MKSDNAMKLKWFTADYGSDLKVDDVLKNNMHVEKRHQARKRQVPKNDKKRVSARYTNYFTNYFSTNLSVMLWLIRELICHVMINKG